MTRARLVASIAILMAMTALAAAQDYPNHLIKVIQGFPPGGNVDVIARIMADEMSKGLGQTVIVETKTWCRRKPCRRNRRAVAR